MNVFLAMDVIGANPNDPSFFLRLPHLWPEFVIPIVCFYTLLAVWVVKKVREAASVKSHGAGNPPWGPAYHEQPCTPMDKYESTAGPAKDHPSSPFELEFGYPFPLSS
jgi:hypothetical protein